MKKRVLAAVILVNVVISLFVTYAYLAFTSRMAIETGVGANYNVIYTQDGGSTQAFVRYGVMVFVEILLQGILAIFNLSVVPYIEADHDRSTRICVFLALACGTLMLAQSVIMLALGLPRPTP